MLVHGYPDNQEVWESVIEHLINDFYIVTYDVRGAGLSSIPKRIRDYRLERLSLDLQEVVDEVIPNRQFHMVRMIGVQFSLGNLQQNLNLKAVYSLIQQFPVHVWIMRHFS